MNINFYLLHSKQGCKYKTLFDASKAIKPEININLSTDLTIYNDILLRSACKYNIFLRCTKHFTHIFQRIFRYSLLSAT